MAVRDRNLFAWQAYVITMTIVSVGLLLGMFFLWRSASDLSSKYTTAEESLSSARSQFQDSESKVGLLRAMIGYGELDETGMEEQLTSFEADAELSEVVAAYRQAMTSFAPGVKANEKSLVKLPEYLLEAIRARNTDIEDARKKVNDLTAKLNATVQSETAARAAAETKLKEAVNDLETARQEHAKAMAAVNKERNDTIQSFTAYKTQRDTELAAEKTKLAQSEAEKAQLAAANEDLQDQVNQFNEPDFASPQGRIMRVANGGTTIWIDLGSEDGLREGVPFSVLDESSVVISDARPKATIIVTKVISAHLSEARAVDVNYKNIVVTGDMVYSPAWRPGRRVGFALVGMMDINGDGKDDIEQVRQLIERAGGKIDAEKPAKGQMINDPGMDHNTSWLVLGTDLSLPENANEALQAQQKAKAKDYEDFIKVARRNGVQQISLDKLMGYLKTKSSDRTVPLGNRTQAKDFPIRPGVSPPASRGSVSDIYSPEFKQRFPSNQ